MEELENALTEIFNSFTHLTPEQKRYVVLVFWLNVENSYKAYKEKEQTAHDVGGTNEPN